MAEGLDQLSTIATIVIALTTGGVAGVLGNRKGKNGDAGDGEGQKLVAASFVDRQVLMDLVTTCKNLDATIRSATELFGRLLAEHEIEERVKDRLAVELARELARMGIPAKPS